MEFFKRADIVFYTLILRESDRESLKNDDVLRDFLEEKICLLLNLPREHEYFLQYALSQDCTAYHCVLLDKEKLKPYAKNANVYLTHPCFLCAGFLEKSAQYQFFLIFDTFAEWTLVGFRGENIVFLQALEPTEILLKLEELRQDYGDYSLSLWCLKEQNNALLDAICTKFQARVVNEELRGLESLGDYNFNPLPKSVSFWKSEVGRIAQSSLLGLVAASLVWAVMSVLNVRLDGEIELLKERKQELRQEIARKQENVTSAQKERIALQEKLESLELQHTTNASFLQNFTPESTLPIAFLRMLNPYLEEHNVKIAYFGMQERDLHLLFIGEGVLKVLESLENRSLGKIEGLEYYDDFVWVRILPNVEVIG